MDIVFQNFSFGIEFEACINIQGKSIKVYDELHKILVECFNKKPIGIQWEIVSKSDFDEDPPTPKSDFDEDPPTPKSDFDDNWEENKRPVMNSTLTSLYLYNSDEKNINEKKYTKWAIMSDDTVKCPSSKDIGKDEKYCILQGRKTDCPPINFHQIEIVSPILKTKIIKDYKNYVLYGLDI